MLGAALAIAATGGCAGVLPAGRSSAPVREQVPVAICIGPLASGAAKATDDVYWSLLWGSAAAQRGRYGVSDVDCSGRRPLSSLAGEEWRRSPSPITWSAAAGAVRAGWLPLQAEAASNLGLLALFGVRGQRHELYGVGLAAGAPPSKLSIERLGSSLMVVAVPAPCASGTATQEAVASVAEGPRTCTRFAQVFALERGTLSQKAEIPIERFERRSASKHSTLEYHFRAALTFQGDRIHVDEHLSVRDSAHGEAQSSHLKRAVELRNGELRVSQPSLVGALGVQRP